MFRTNTPSLTDRNERYRDIFLAASALTLLIYVVLRAALLSFTTDENGTYTMFVTQGVIIPHQFDLYSANNHLLNTWLMMLSEKVFGSSEFALRLPNVLAYVLYLWSTAMLSRRFKSPLFGAAAFLVLNLQPYLVQYFSLARGYGMADGLMAAAIYMAWRYFQDGWRVRHLAGAMIFAALAVLANFTNLNLLLPFAGLLGVLALWQPDAGEVSCARRIGHAALVGVIALATLAFVIPIGLKLKAANALFSDANQGIWQNTVPTLIKPNLFDMPYAAQLVQPLRRVVDGMYWIACIFIPLGFFIALRKGKKDVGPAFILLLVTLAGFSVVLQHKLFGTEYVTLRMGLFFVLPFLLAFVLGLDRMPGPRAIPLTVILLFAGVTTFHFVHSMNLWHGWGWPEAEDTKTVAKIVDDYRKTLKPGTHLRMGYDGALNNLGLTYYRMTGKFENVDLTEDPAMAGNPLNDFCFVTAGTRNLAPDSLWKVYREFPSGNRLLVPRKKLATALFTVSLGEKTFTPETDGRVDSTQLGVGLAQSYDDSVHKARYYLVRGEVLVKRMPGAVSYLFLTCHHEKEQYFVQAWFLEELVPADGAFHTIQVTAAIPSELRYKDEIGLSVCYNKGSGTQLKTAKMKIEGY